MHSHIPIRLRHCWNASDSYLQALVLRIDLASRKIPWIKSCASILIIDGTFSNQKFLIFQKCLLSWVVVSITSTLNEIRIISTMRKHLLLKCFTGWNFIVGWKNNVTLIQSSLIRTTMRSLFITGSSSSQAKSSTSTIIWLSNGISIKVLWILSEWK